MIVEASLEAARAVVITLEPYFKKHGWLLALYGSTLTATRGRDIDLVAFPWRPRADVPAAVAELEKLVGFTKSVDDPYLGLMGTTAFKGITEDGLLIDIVFRETSSPFQS